MKYTIRKIENGVATVDFEGGSWAMVNMDATDTEVDFALKVSAYAPKVSSTPDWAIPESTEDGVSKAREVLTTDVTGSPITDTIEDFDVPEWLDDRMAAYGTTSSQIEFITENGLAAWQEEVAAIKKTNPKD
tara:strand:- start:788 stop:1183 length:396 start_codon:yes stop_codon:yes gene_type:complete